MPHPDRHGSQAAGVGWRPLSAGAGKQHVLRCGFTYLVILRGSSLIELYTVHLNSCIR